MPLQGLINDGAGDGHQPTSHDIDEKQTGSAMEMEIWT